MARQLIVQNTYVPKVGEGKALLAALRDADRVWRDAGFPGLELWKCFHGPHNAVTTIQRWTDIAAWEAARQKTVETPSLVSAVFDRIYPTNAVAYDTQLFELMDEPMP